MQIWGMKYTKPSFLRFILSGSYLLIDCILELCYEGLRCRIRSMALDEKKLWRFLLDFGLVSLWWYQKK